MDEKKRIGWREWVSLPDLGIALIKCKVDTGAKTSALHAFYIDPFYKEGKKWIRFGMHPRQHDTKTVLHCEAAVHDERHITSSNGEKTLRYIIETTMVLGDAAHKIELSLANRDTMKFRMLLGRRALENHYLIDPAHSYLAQG